MKMTEIVPKRKAIGIEDKRIVLNIGGCRHETLLSTLERLPGTRLAVLASLQEADDSYDVTTGEYFFDRHPKAFETVIQFYRTEELHVGQSACGNILKRELHFWGIEEQEIEPCCWADYSKYTEHKQTLMDLDDNFAYASENGWEDSDFKYKKIAATIWMFLEDPGSSRAAKIYAIISMFFVALSIAVFVLETHKLFQIDEISGKAMYVIQPEDEVTPTGSMNFTCCCEMARETGNATVEEFKICTHPALMYLDYLCVIYFTLELLLRFIFCPHKRRFFRTPLNAIDLICLIPHFASIIMTALEVDASARALVKTIMMLRVIRILRIFKLMKHYNAFKILVYTIKVSTKELLLMIVFLMSGVLMFASMIHYMEQDNFPNIPIAIWWALVTMTTVGYGDKYPVGYVGYLMGSMCVICGVLVIAFTVPIVVNNFSLYYSHAQTRIKMPNRKKRQMIMRACVVTAEMRAKRMTGSTQSSNSDINFSAIPEKGDSGVVLNAKDLGKTLNIHPPEKAWKKKTRHGKDDKKRRPETVTPVETMEDIDSLDSGYNEELNKQLTQESKKIMADLEQTTQRYNEEKKRQEWLIRQKREARQRQQIKVTEKLANDKQREGRGTTKNRQSETKA